MGPSGAGKTTFMNALCGRAYYGTARGVADGNFLSLKSVVKCKEYLWRDRLDMLYWRDVEVEIWFDVAYFDIGTNCETRVFNHKSRWL